MAAVGEQEERVTNPYVTRPAAATPAPAAPSVANPYLLGPTQPNRFYLHSAQSGGRKNNDLPPQLADEHPEWIHGFDWPTIWGACKAAGVSATYYYSNLPQIAFWGERHLEHARPIAEYYAAAAAGTLPQVSFIDPWFIGPEGLANDDHPHADIRLGQAFISDVVEAFACSPCLLQPKP